MDQTTRNKAVENALAAERKAGGQTAAHFAIRNLSVLAYAQGFTLWHYRAPALALKQVVAPAFFDPAADMLAVGDMILVSASDGGGVVFVTSASDAGGVSVARMAG
jgi:hypothetical protein